jgi:ferredoxin
MIMMNLHLMITRSDKKNIKERRMKATITEECISCGLCVNICPEVFEMGDNLAMVKMEVIPAEFEKAAQQAADECPVTAIKIEQ